jgi:hypothetical protein
MWAGGWLNSLFRFDGSQWNKINVDQRLWFKSFQKFAGKDYALAYKIDDEPLDSTWYYFLSWNGTQWDTLDIYLSRAIAPGQPTFGSNMLTVIEGELYSAGGGIFKWSEGEWREMLSHGAGIFGATGKSLFVVGWNGQVEYYDGKSWHDYGNLGAEGYFLTTGWTNGQEAFIVGDNGSNSLVLHGK